MYSNKPRGLVELGVFMILFSFFFYPAMHAIGTRQLPGLEIGVPFPETGSVTVATDLPMSSVRSRLSVRTSASNAVVQLVHPETNRHALSVFVAANSEVTIPAPVGIWRMRVIEGQKWHGNARFFGPNTEYETVAELMEFGHSRGNGIDLHRRIDGNLKTRQMLMGPEPL